MEHPPWHRDLYAGAATHYSRGRLPYPTALADELARRLPLHGTQRLLDLGCGPGSLTLLLAPHVAEAVGIDADAAMLDEAARLASHAGLDNLTWRYGRAEDLLDDHRSQGNAGTFDVVTLAQSFHWMDRPTVAPMIRQHLNPGGALVHLHATTHQGIATDDATPHPQPPHAATRALVARYLAGVDPVAPPPPAAEVGAIEAPIYRAAGFSSQQRFAVPGRTLVRTTEQIVSALLSLSWAAPHRFGNDLPTFTTELRDLLDQTSPGGLFCEQQREIVVDIWR